MARASPAKATCSSWRWRTTSSRRAAPGSATAASASARAARTRATSSSSIPGSSPTSKASCTRNSASCGRTSPRAFLPIWRSRPRWRRNGAPRRPSRGEAEGRSPVTITREEPAIARLLHQSRQAELPVGSGEVETAARLFADPTAVPNPLEKLADKTAARLSRRYLAARGPFAGLPLHNGLCAIEARTCATIALSAFEHARISPGAAVLATKAALSWRALLVELLAGLALAQEDGKATRKGLEQVIRSQRLPVREARVLRRALLHPREVAQIAPALHSEALRRFMLTQVLLAALVDGRLEAAELAFVARLARAVGVDAAALARLEAEVSDFYREHKDALAALRLAETPEGLPHALTTRLEAAVLDNLDRLLQEIRETRELGELLAKAAAGGTLSGEERAKIREQLIDLAKTIPALAIFAAPGGMLLLPILFKLLPFNLLPSSFTDPPPVPALPEPRRRSG